MAGGVSPVAVYGIPFVLLAYTSGLAYLSRGEVASPVSVLLYLFGFPALLVSFFAALMHTVPLVGLSTGWSASPTHGAKEESQTSDMAIQDDTDYGKARDDKDEKPKDNDGEKERWRKIEQVWDDKMYDWVERKQKEASAEPEDANLLFKALHRSYQFDDQTGYTLLQLYVGFQPHLHRRTKPSRMSVPLVKALRAMPDIKDSEELWAEDPSVRAQDVFLFSPELRSDVAKRKELLEEKKKAPVTNDEKTDTASDPKTSDPALESLEESDNMTPEQLEESIDHLEILLAFIDKDYSSTKQKLDHLNRQGKISFRLLWTLFKPGSIGVAVHSTTEDKLAMKVTRAVYTKREDVEQFLVTGECVEWNGEKIYRSHLQRSITFFTGLRKTSQLAIYPITPKLHQEFTERGRRYLTYIGEPKYVHYTGALVQRVGKDIIKTRAEGRCVADMASYRRLNPGMDLWCDSDTDYDDKSSVIANLDPEVKLSQREIAEDELCLVPPTIFGFSLVLKEWGEMVYEQFEPIQFDEHAWDHLELEPYYKKLIRALVEASCSEEKASKVVKDVIQGKVGGFVSTNKDVPTPWQGQGLIALLHGKPGTGKTLTSESIAELLKRPLYSISAGELGTEPRLLERTLRDTLELARTWRAVLLIVILEARSQHEIQRNGLVSIFLRLLEYHQGVLLLTTNRIKTFDEAFLSRFSVAIRYPDLDIETRKTIWTKFLKFAGVHVGTAPDVNGDAPDGTVQPHPIPKSKLEEFASKRINGREIKQVIRTAQAIALSDNVPLAAEHIESVLKMQAVFAEDFKTYDQEGMYKAKGEEHDSNHLYQ